MLATYRPYLILTLLCIALYIPGISTIPLVDRDEAHFAQATKQMLETGEYFKIRFQETTRFQKPPGINWLQAISIKSFSTPQSDAVWPYRIPSILSAILAILGCFYFAKQITDEKIALLSSALLSCALLISYESHIAVTDTTLLLTVIAMQAALGTVYLNYFANKATHWSTSLIFWLALSAGILVKGITPLFAVLTCIALCIREKNTGWLRALHIWWGLLLLLIVSSIWLIFVSIAEQSNYLIQMFWKDLWPKLTSGHESHGGFPGYHSLLMPLTYWPSSLFLWLAIIHAWRHRTNRVITFLIAWIMPSWLFYELMPTKLPQYIMPLFPVISLLSAKAIYNSISNPYCAKVQRCLRIGIVGWGILGSVLAAAFIFIPLFISGKILTVSVLVACSILLMTWIAVIAAYKQHYLQAAYIVIFGSLITYSTSYQWFFSGMPELWLSKNITSHVQQNIPKQLSSNTPLLVVGYHEPSLVFQLGTDKVHYTNLDYALKQLIQFQNIVVLINSHDYVHLQLRASKQLVKLKEVSRLQGFNYTKSRWMTLILVTRGQA